MQSLPTSVEIALVVMQQAGIHAMARIVLPILSAWAIIAKDVKTSSWPFSFAKTTIISVRKPELDAQLMAII
jgi:hypothetical protein